MNLDPQIPEWTPEGEEAFRRLEDAESEYHYREQLEILETEQRRKAHALNVAICNALLDEEWNDDHTKP